MGKTGAPKAHKTSLTRLRDKLKVIFRRSRGTSLKFTISRVSQLLRGWRAYFEMDARIEIYRELDIHIRRHLRKLIWIAWKKPRTRKSALIRRGLDSERAWKSPVNGRGAWCNAGASHMRQTYNNNCFRRLGLYSLELQH